MKLVGAQREVVHAKPPRVDRDLAHGLRRVAEQQRTARLRRHRNLGDREDDPRLVVRQHGRNQQRVVAERRSNLTGRQPTRRRDGKHRHLVSLRPEPLDRMQHRVVLHRRDHNVAPLGPRRSSAEDGQVTGLRCAGGEDNLFRPASDEATHRHPRLPKRLARLLRKEVDARRIAIEFAEVGHHRSQHLR